MPDLSNFLLVQQDSQLANTRVTNFNTKVTSQRDMNVILRHLKSRHHNPNRCGLPELIAIVGLHL
jgi:iron-sulfur cluster repair protein YtfE (RIC family)